MSIEHTPIRGLMAAERLLNEKDDELHKLRMAIRLTAFQGTYNETEIRKAVSFELAELIVAARNGAY